MKLSTETSENLLESIAKKLNISKEKAAEYVKMPFDEQKEYLKKIKKKFSNCNPFLIADSAYTID